MLVFNEDTAKEIGKFLILFPFSYGSTGVLFKEMVTRIKKQTQNSEAGYVSGYRD